MKLIGMLDSPYVRRVAISLLAMEIPFTHQSLSVFRNFEEFAAINPVVKAPTLVLDDNTVLMESGLILEVAERMAAPGRSLMPSDMADYVRAQRIIGLALAACDKVVQVIYERNLRPADKQHQPWIDRVQGQILAAYQALENEISPTGTWLFGDRPSQADITAAVVWRFTQFAAADCIDPAICPALTALSRRAEALPDFIATPLE